MAQVLHGRHDPDTVFQFHRPAGTLRLCQSTVYRLTWNLARLAETLITLVDPNQDRALELLTVGAKEVSGMFVDAWLARMRLKIGLNSPEDNDVKLINRLLEAMHQGKADFTLTFRRLSDVLRGNGTSVRTLFEDPAVFDAWESDWRVRLVRESLCQGLRRLNGPGEPDIFPATIRSLWLLPSTMAIYQNFRICYRL